jgi:hypothetical protein
MHGMRLQKLRSTLRLPFMLILCEVSQAAPFAAVAVDYSQVFTCVRYSVPSESRLDACECFLQHALHAHDGYRGRSS